MTTPAHLFKTARRQMRKIRHRGPQSETERRLLASADQQREQGLGWRYDGFREWTDAQLFESLARFGICLDEASFREKALIAGSPTALGESWQALSTAQGKWRDLPTLAARDLWRRLLPDSRAPEVVADQVDELLEEAEVRPSRPSLWLKAAQRLVWACLPDGKPDRPFFEAVSRESGSDLVGWMIEMPAALLGTADEAEAPGLCEAFARLGDEKAMRAERAEILSRLGRGDEARTEIAALLDRHGEDPLVLLKAGAVHEALRDVPASQQFFRRYEEALRQPSSARSIAAAGRAGVALPAPRAGPNDRCPCGSGKKYKRCHGLPS
ncbi:MAG: SEC-C domain-containing protein [Deltaproteobacteria bacterium]|nr:SEC-C domain-containing protein [Deltaproteobacteria bacterium]